ncbi:GNAT family N-acetyltransferase [Bythopirellula goksoeyrii]|uniref:BioF2-like acetyltransferase domain-containing protein n=1 Tax=Bythopirellula goksoeyrii TaxID=1400387 RepID=A0A5B9Q9T3_9BACT|nr:GNAT family N-acetyltransferase [Bythopirellula goksoeyrii]QEG35638.1 hypothetical protein Pr1d_29400 [Bythopirellula goksoeyrii]
MNIKRVEQFEDLLEYQERWDELAGGCVFRCWTWLSTWWKHYGVDLDSRKLTVLLVFEDSAETNSARNEANFVATTQDYCRTPQALLGILPCYLESTRWQGNVLHMLGDGEVCSEHLELLCVENDADRVAESIAQYLASEASSWDTWNLDVLDEESTVLGKALAKLKNRGSHISRQLGPNCWSIQLPATWDEFLAMQSKSHRKQLRRLDSRVLQSDRASWHLVESETEFDQAWETLIDLHQRRRQSLGEPGCFASRQWAAFHRDVARQLLKSGKLRLSVLELDGEAIAAEYHFAAADILYVYQGGLDPDRCEEEPGRLSMIRCVQQAIAEGQQEFDLLRGDEPYKPHWRAIPRQTVNIQVVSPRIRARWRSLSSSGLRNAGRLLNQFANLLS